MSSAVMLLMPKPEKGNTQIRPSERGSVLVHREGHQRDMSIAPDGGGESEEKGTAAAGPAQSSSSSDAASAHQGGDERMAAGTGSGCADGAWM